MSTFIQQALLLSVKSVVSVSFSLCCMASLSGNYVNLANVCSSVLMSECGFCVDKAALKKVWLLQGGKASVQSIFCNNQHQ